jgi:copper transport protein
LDGETVTVGVLAPTLTATVWGYGWLVGVGGAALLFVGWSLPRRVAGVVGTPLALTGALGMLLGPALSGHAVASRWFVPSVTLDVLHVAAAGLWIGGVLMVLCVGVPSMRALTDGNRDAAVRALVSSFHPLALFCAPLVVIAGVGMSWIRLGSLDGLRTPYGTTLLWKVGMFVLVMSVGGYNAFRARKRLGTPDGTRRFVVSGGLELTFAAAVLAVTTMLVVTPVPSDITP